MSEIRKYVSPAERYAKVPYVMVPKAEAPPKAIVTPGGRRLTLGALEREKPRYKGDISWSDNWPVLLDGKEIASLSRNLNYGTTPEGKPRWQGSLTKLRWLGSVPPTGLGFDVSGCDSAKDCLRRMGHNMDQVFDWREGRETPSLPPGTKRG
jgi:hypothetical protein